MGRLFWVLLLKSDSNIIWDSLCHTKKYDYVINDDTSSNKEYGSPFISEM